MEGQQCLLCSGTGWMDIRVDPVPPWSDWLSVDQDADPCPLCYPDGSAPNYFDLSDEVRDTIPYWFATAVGGFEGQYGHFQNFDEQGNLLHSVLVDRSVLTYTTWVPDPDNWSGTCPVCEGWGLFSDNGKLQPCIGCNGRSAQDNSAFNPVHAYWLNWKAGHKHILTQRQYHNIFG